jgi:glycosyltransferase involved in cell wall biosynthesis
VSIIINNYNYGRFLKEAIDSTLNQSYPKTEVIVVDDGSTDNSRQIIANYGQRIIPVLKHNGGQASALNAGFAHSHGEVVIFLDADDILLPETVQRVVDIFQGNPDIARVQYRLEIMDT